MPATAPVVHVPTQHERYHTEEHDAGQLDAFAHYWARLWDTPMPNRVKVFAYRLQHTALPCLSFSFLFFQQERFTKTGQRS
jgi:hypothetical protein